MGAWEGAQKGARDGLGGHGRAQRAWGALWEERVPGGFRRAHEEAKKERKGRNKEIKKERKTNRQTNRQTDRQTERKKERKKIP
jgi:hypothetical protein